MNCIIVIQARTTSSRLPGKVLLPVSEVPVVVLAAKRAGNAGDKVLVVTSDNDSDDCLCSVLKNNSLDFYRGSLSNPLDRYVKSLAHFDDDTIVVRLTADNVFPDGKFIEELKTYYTQNELSYLCCNGRDSGLPYGVSAELMKLKDLREAHHYCTNNYDLEHVTPYIRRKYGAFFYKGFKDVGMGGYRCTIDTLDDYLSVNRYFIGVKDPLTVSLSDLLTIVKKTSELECAPLNASDLVLGGAQFGLCYGVNNKVGRPNEETILSIINEAVSNGVTCIDTAREYGDSESVLGNVLETSIKEQISIITKLSLLQHCDDTASKEVVEGLVKASCFESMMALKVTRLECMMLHRVQHLEKWHGVVWDMLKNLKDDGVVRDLGVSVQTPEELLCALDYEDVTFLQMPFNILDYRWVDGLEKIKEIKRERRLVIHARSSLLQGLLAVDDEELWLNAHVSDPSTVISWLKIAVKDYSRDSIVDLCIAYVRSQNWVDGVVIGMETQSQLRENLKYFSNKLLSKDELLKINELRPVLSTRSLNPALWKG